MTDEERTDELIQKAEEGYNKHCTEDDGYPSDLELYKDGYTDGYEQGYEDCRHYAHDYYKPKWHDLRKNPNDLPKHSGLYCVQSGEVREYVKEEKSWFTVHFEPCMNRTEETYLWCELPKFEE